MSIVENHLLQGEAREVTKYCKGFKYYKISRSRQAMGLATNIVSKLPYQVRYFYDRSIKEEINEEIKKINPDAIYCQLIRMAPYTRKLDYPLIIDYMDAFSLIMKRRLDRSSSFFRTWFYKLESKRLKAYEAKVQARFSVKTIISHQDKEAMIGVKDLEVISNGVDTTYFQPKSIAKKYDLLFAGNMGYAPNISAADYLVNEIVKDQNLTVLIAGARPVHRVQQLASELIKVSGWMEDIREAYHQSTIFVAPLFEGAGQQNKILQSMAMGIPCITTPIVNAGIGAKEQEEILIADSPDTFNKHITELLSNESLRKKLSENARRFVEQKFSWKEQNEKLLALISKCIN